MSELRTDADTETESVIDQLVERHRTLFSEEIGLDSTQNTLSVLFPWLCAALVMSARISQATTIKVAHGLIDGGWTTPEHMIDSTWQDCADALKEVGYGRYDESTARLVQDTYDGDLRKLRAQERRDPERQRQAPKAFKGIGDVGADIFFRGLQSAWSEHYPLMDETARAAVSGLGVPNSAATLADRIGRGRFVRGGTALSRVELEDIDHAQLLEDEERASA